MGIAPKGINVFSVHLNQMLINKENFDTCGTINVAVPSVKLYSCQDKGKFVNMVYLRGICGHVSEWNGAIALIPFHVKRLIKTKLHRFLSQYLELIMNILNWLTSILNAFHKGFRMLISEALIKLTNLSSFLQFCNTKMKSILIALLY